MPLLLQDLFEETKNHRISEDEKKKMARSCIYIKNLDVLPDLVCPQPDDVVHKDDVKELLRCYHNPVLPEKFLKLSDDSVKEIFKKYCKVNDLKIDWKLLNNYCKDLWTVIGKLKHKHDRPRPKEFLGKDYKDIIDVDSPSFPSGHTAAGYFFADMISSVFLGHRSALRNLADLVGQSRIENGVHFPSDVAAGKLIGETVASLCIRDSSNVNRIGDYRVKKNHVKDLVKKLRDKGDIKDICYYLSDFICRSNQIENYNVNQNECIEACKLFLGGYPLEDCTDDHHIKSHLKGLVAANQLHPINNSFKFMQVHKQFDKKCLEKGKPGQFRNFKSFAKKTGNSYANPGNIFNYLENIKIVNNPYAKHIIYEHIHPFCDGNGRSGRIILLIDTDFDFENTLRFCDKKYFNRIENFIQDNPDLDETLNILNV